MTITETLTEKVSQLPNERQLEVLDFVEFLEQKQRLSGPRRSLRGALAGKIPDLIFEDFQQARKEMWSRFPRELPK